MGPLSLYARLFTLYTTAMYTNIEPAVGISAVNEWLKTTPNLPKDFPSKLVLEALEIIMKIKVFQFDDTFWHQDTGKATGTPYVCSYSTLSHVLHELKRVVPLFQQSMTYLKRWIKDMLGIWTGKDDKEWLRFKTALNGFGKLNWITSKHTKGVIFLDLRISINIDGKIETKTYVKSMNLNLYIPGIPALPDGCLWGTIFGNALRYWQQKPTSKTSQH
jgi:hypothetical protein